MAALAWGAGLFVFANPVLLAGPTADAAESWRYGLLLASAQHLHWGDQIVFTYGPLGYAAGFEPFDRSRLLVGLVAMTLVHGGLVAAVGAHLWRSEASPAHWLVAAFAILLTGFVVDALRLTLLDEAVVLAVFLLFLALRQESETRAAMTLVVAAGTLVAFAVLVKESALVSLGGAATVGFALFVLQGRPRLAALLPSTLVAAFGLLWLASGQVFSTLPAFARGTAEEISGYSQAMQLPDPAGFTWLGAAVVVSVPIATALLLRRWRGPAVQLSLLGLPALATDFKEGFVRADEHVLGFFAFAGLLVVLLHLVATRERPVPGDGLPPALFRVLTASAAVAMMAPLALTQLAPQHLAVRAANLEAAARIALTPGADGARAEAFKASLRSFYRLPPEVVASLRQGSVDVYPIDVGPVLAYDLRWDPRPVLEAYSAYTPYLDGIDAAHFRGPAAPDRVLFELKTIDDRYAPFDEPETVRALLTRYRVESVEEPFAVLVRADQPAVVTEEPEGTTCRPQGVPIGVPARPGRLVFGRVHAPYSVQGRLLDLAFKPSLLRITLRSAAGEAFAHRLVSAVAPDGLFLGSYVQDAGDWERVAQGALPAPIASLAVEGLTPGDYQPQVCVTFFSLPAATSVLAAQ